MPQITALRGWKNTGKKSGAPPSRMFGDTAVMWPDANGRARNNPRNAEGEVLGHPSTAACSKTRHGENVRYLSSVGELSRSQQVEGDRPVVRRERRPAFLAGPECASSTAAGA